MNKKYKSVLKELSEMETDQSRDAHLELVMASWTFGTEELSRHSPPLKKVEKEPSVLMHIDDAARLGLSDGDRVKIKLDGGALEVNVTVRENMASGVIVMPRHRLLEWQKIRTLPKIVRFEEIEKQAI